MSDGPYVVQDFGQTGKPLVYDERTGKAVLRCESRDEAEAQAAQLNAAVEEEQRQDGKS